MQSGITASKELQEAFAALLTDPSQYGLTAGISPAPESLVPLHTIPSSSSDFKADLANLEPHIEDNAAAYVLLKQRGAKTGSGTAQCVAVTYVPDKAAVRQKMLFAATRLTLVRELGTERFASTLFATSKDELTAEGWTKHEAHGSLSAPLTDEEQNLEGIRDAEAQESRGTGARKGGHIVEGGIKIALPPDATEALKRLNNRELDLVQLRIDVATEKILLSSTQPASECPPASLGRYISSTSPQYSFYSYKSETYSNPLILFIYTCPGTASIKERMLYASFSRSMTATAEAEAGVTVSKRMEASGPEETSEDAIRQEMEPQAKSQETLAGSARTSSTFARPKRPGRR